MKSVEQSLYSEAGSSWVTYEIHNFPLSCTPAIFPILNQLNPLHALVSYFIMIHFNIIFPFTTRSARCFFSISSRHPNPVCISFVPHSCYIPRLSHSSYHPNNKPIQKKEKNHYYLFWSQCEQKGLWIYLQQALSECNPLLILSFHEILTR